MLQKSKKTLHLFEHVKAIVFSSSHDSETFCPIYSVTQDNNKNISEFIWELSSDVKCHLD